MNTAELLVRCLENEGVRYVLSTRKKNLDVLQALKNLRFNSLLRVMSKARHLWLMSMVA
jgi:thiamine pyrophosphate-dependent acetolactate synthase large subunit-like protein